MVSVSGTNSSQAGLVEDGQGRWVDDVFVGRLSRSVKCEGAYLRAYETPAKLRAGAKHYVDFYNARRRHAALGRNFPDAMYLEQAGGIHLAGCPVSGVHFISSGVTQSSPASHLTAM